MSFYPPMSLRQQLIDFEGWERCAYPDPLTRGAPWTIGVGHCGPEVHEHLVWSDDLIGATLDADIAEKTAQCYAHFPWFGTLNEQRQAVLIGMCFQMGMGKEGPLATGLLAFQQTLAAIRDERFAHAGECMRQSRWARQTPKRAARLAYQMETGQWG
jgi:lysozyme